MLHSLPVNAALEVVACAASQRGSTPRADTLAAMARHLGYTLLLRGHGEEIELEGVDDADSDQGPAD